MKYVKAKKNVEAKGNNIEKIAIEKEKNVFAIKHEVTEHKEKIFRNDLDKENEAEVFLK